MAPDPPFELEGLEEALHTLGEVLHSRQQHAAVLVVGGGSLLLLGLVNRPTADLDVVGMPGTNGYEATPLLPEFLEGAAADVGNSLGIGPRWLNGEPAGLLDFGLPEGSKVG